MLEAIGAGSSKRIGPTDWKDLWLASPEFAQLCKEIEILKEEGAARPDDHDTSESTCKSFATSLGDGSRC